MFVEINSVICLWMSGTHNCRAVPMKKIADPWKWIEQTCVEIADGIRRCHFIALALRGKKISYHLRALRLFPRSLRRAMASLP